MPETLGLSSRAIIGRFYQTLEKGLAGLWMPEVSMLFTSDQPQEDYRWLGMPPAMREWIGGRQPRGLRGEAYQIQNRKFEATLDIELDDLRRDKTGQVMMRVDEMADRANEHWETLGSDLVVNGAAGLCYDGLPFFSALHVEGASGIQINNVAAAEVPALNVAVPATPTPAEMALAILGLIGWQYRFVDDQAQPINGQARSFIVMTPVALWAPAAQAVSLNNLNSGVGTIDNPLAVTRQNGISLKVVANPLLDVANWTTTFCLFRADGRAKPFIRQEETGVQVSAVAEGSEYEFDNDRHKYGIKASRAAGYGLWQHAQLVTLS